MIRGKQSARLGMTAETVDQRGTVNSVSVGKATPLIVNSASDVMPFMHITITANLTF